MKLNRKHAGAIAAVIVALIAGTLAQTGGDAPDTATRSDKSSRGDDRQAYQNRKQVGTSGNQRRERNVPGEFDYYSLVLSWSPTYCAGNDRKKPDRQCEGHGGRGYAFVLHGLWPQYENGFPDTCWTREKPYVQRQTINEMLDIMPSPGLVIHEYKKHGTCSGLSPERYYQLSRVLYQKIKIPKRYLNPTTQQLVAPGELVQEFVTANPGLRSNMMAVSCRGTGNRLRELRFCFSRDGKLRECGRNETRMCSAKKMYLPPVRVSATR